MANRQMKAKVLKGKLKGRYKARSGTPTELHSDGSLKKWGTGVVNTGPTSSSAFSGVAYKQAANPFEHYWDTIFKDSVAKAEPTPREETLATLSRMLEDQDLRLKFAVVNRPSLRVDLFFNSQGNRYFLLETDILHGVVRRSHIYINKHIALNAHKANAVRWKTEVRT